MSGALFEMLPDMPLEGSGQLRTRTGAAVEDVTCALLKINRLPIDGRKTLCWDAEACGVPLEIKSLKPGGRSIIYKWRAEKERAWEAAEHRCAYYIFTVHRTTGCKSLAEIYRSLSGGVAFYIVPARAVRRWLKPLTLRFVKALEKPDPRRGDQRKGYIEGYYSLPWKSFAPVCTETALTLSGSFHGVEAQATVSWVPGDRAAKRIALNAL